MIDKLTQFQWTVAESGYRLTKLAAVGEVSESLYLTPSIPLGTSYAGARYGPPSGLFHSFAELQPKQSQILKFASRWGMLTAGAMVPLNNSVVPGEPLAVWIGEIADLSLAFRLWEWIKSGDVSRLGRYIKWTDSSGVMFDRSADNVQAWRWIASREINPSLLETFRVGDLIMPAWYQLQHIINDKLAGSVSARLLWNGSHTQLSLHQVPKDLISALWLQFARAIEGNREYQQCKECRNWFEVSSADGGRKDKRFCSTACRARHWRKAQEGKK